MASEPSAPEPLVPEPPVLVTPDGVKYWPPRRHAAWFGLLQAHTVLVRAIDADLIARHGLNLSAYQLLSRLAHAEEGHLRMSQLAEQTVLSQSRISRIADQLEQRGLIARSGCPTDSRVVHAELTPAGRELMREAQDTYFSGVEERFLGRMSCEEVAVLAAVFERLAGPPCDACGGPAEGA